MSAIERVLTILERETDAARDEGGPRYEEGGPRYEEKETPRDGAAPGDPLSMTAGQMRELAGNPAGTAEFFVQASGGIPGDLLSMTVEQVRELAADPAGNYRGLPQVRVRTHQGAAETTAEQTSSGASPTTPGSG